jgi:hypothetical protein
MPEQTSPAVANAGSHVQLGLFEAHDRPRSAAPIFAKKDPITSELAAESVARTGAIFVDYMRAHQQAQTSAEIAQRGGFDRYNVARRMSALARQGHVKRKGVRLCAACGRECVTWAVVAK